MAPPLVPPQAPPQPFTPSAVPAPCNMPPFHQVSQGSRSSASSGCRASAASAAAPPAAAALLPRQGAPAMPAAVRRSSLRASRRYRRQAHSSCAAARASARPPTTHHWKGAGDAGGFRQARAARPPTQQHSQEPGGCPHSHPVVPQAGAPKPLQRPPRQAQQQRVPHEKEEAGHRPVVVQAQRLALRGRGVRRRQRHGVRCVGSGW